ncbi:macrophage colony-stimulating factor 1 receptor isoform X2 [Hoplias malabaricus]|uniref:macrophage colony-stimulating factor 1 receptor isoform X2 n=1 Tax=Hoplias malabaricus TaxID=27720 RepID=UPI003462C6C4
MRPSLNSVQVQRDILTVTDCTAEHTRTYRCSYKNQKDLFSEIHIFVKDPDHLFTTPRRPEIVVEEGSSCNLDCLLTDPTGTGFSLWFCNGSSVSPHLNYTVDPKVGINIWNIQPSDNGDYCCSITFNNRTTISTVYRITVYQRPKPPSVFTERDEYIGIVGETLEIKCLVINEDHSFHVTWENSLNATLNRKDIHQGPNGLRILSVVTFHELRVSDSGNLTCSGRTKIGVNSSTVSLTVKENPFAVLTPLLKLRRTSDVDDEGDVEVGADADAVAMVMEGEILELRVKIDAHPPILEKSWSTPRNHNSSFYLETFHSVNRSYRAVASLFLRGVRADDRGMYVFSARSSSVKNTTQFKIHVYQKPRVLLRMRNGSLSCVSSGFPQPTIHWKQCPSLQNTCSTNDSSTVALFAPQFPLEPVDEFSPAAESFLPWENLTLRTSYECVSENKVGQERDIFYTEDIYVQNSMSGVESPEYFRLVFGGLTVIIALLLLLLGVCVFKWKQKPRYEIRWKIIEANDGNNYTYIDANQLPYNSKWEFPRDKLTFGEVLGAGAFGKVVEATALGLEKHRPVSHVAVKMLKSSAHSEEKEALMSELKILSHLGSHTNVVNLLGACTQGGPVLLITEYCSQGDLLNFLRRRAEPFLNSFLQEQGGYNLYKNLPEPQNHIKRYNNESYQDMSRHRDKHCPQGWCGGVPETLTTLDLDDLIRFSTHVAQGMHFLSSKNCIHRDVAARNVLVNEQFVAKICDFGLARDIVNDSSYVVRGNARLPVKWMSPESIFECVYTVQSDVWSYGILLWEIFSLGRSPYPDVVVDARFYKMIKAGFQMPQPDFAPPEMYSIMKMCWSLDPTSRPTFGDILKLLPEFSEQDLSQPRPAEEQQPLIRSNNYQLC